MHPLASGAVRNGNGTRSLGCARIKEAAKRRKYTKLSCLRCYEQLPFVVEKCGGFGPSADVLIKDMADASEEHMRMWSRDAVIRQLVGSVAVCLFVCYFVFDWWGVSTATQIRLVYWSAVCAASQGSGMSLHAHGIVTERSWSPYQNLVGKRQRRTST